MFSLLPHMTLHIATISTNICQFGHTCIFLSCLLPPSLLPRVLAVAQSVLVTCFLWSRLETVSNTEPINNGFSKLPAPVRVMPDAWRRKVRRTFSVMREKAEAMNNYVSILDNLVTKWSDKTLTLNLTKYCTMKPLKLIRHVGVWVCFFCITFYRLWLWAHIVDYHNILDTSACRLDQLKLAYISA